ncbi:hypothetical protein [Ferruginibacter sp.]
MKIVTIISAFTILSTASFAQYKKASFLNKDGRTHELGSNISFFGNNGGSTVLSVVYSGSLETEKKLSTFTDIELMMKGKFSYNAEYYSPSAGTTVTGMLYGEKPPYLMLKYGLQYRFTKKEIEEDNKLVPYLRLGLLYGIALNTDYKLKDKSGNSVTENTTPSLPSIEVPFGVEAGAGITYYFTKNLGVKVGANYRQFFQIDALNGGNNDESTLYPLKNHPGISIALKYRIFKEE